MRTLTIDENKGNIGGRGRVGRQMICRRKKLLKLVSLESEGIWLKGGRKEGKSNWIFRRRIRSELKGTTKGVKSRPNPLSIDEHFLSSMNSFLRLFSSLRRKGSLVVSCDHIYSVFVYCNRVMGRGKKGKKREGRKTD